MSIYVSRYANKEVAKDQYYPVGISIGKPKFPLGYTVRNQCYALAPKGSMLSMGYDEYRPAYMAKLDSLGKHKVISIVRELEKAADQEGKILVLLCYEDVRVPGEWCHRTLFSEWWEKNTGEIIEELRDESEPKIKKKKAEKPVKEAPLEPLLKQISMFA